MGINIGVVTTNVVKDFRYYNSPYFKISEPIEGTSDTFHLLGLIESIDFPVKLEYGQVLKLPYNLSKGFLDRMDVYRKKGVTLTAYVQTTVGEKFKSNELDIDQLFITE